MPSLNPATGYRCILWICKNTPFQFLEKALPFISKLYNKLDKKHSINVKNNLHIIGKHLGKDLSYLEGKVYQHFGMFMVEFFGANKTYPVPEFQQKELIKKMGRPNEKANLILVGHYGNWEIALKQLLYLGYSVTTVAMRHSNKEVDDFFQELRCHPNLTVAYLDQGIRPCMKAIKNKGVLALACERDYTGSGIGVQIAGMSVQFPKGPAWLLTKYKLDTFLGTCKRTSLNHFETDLTPLDISKELLESDDAITQVTQTIADSLFEHIYKNPEQWITFDDFFLQNTN